MIEAWYKHHLKGKNKHKISAVPPEPYQARFCQFIEDNILVNRNKGIKKQKGDGGDSKLAEVPSDQ